MKWLRRLLLWLVRPNLRVLESNASQFGAITLSQVAAPKGWSWIASIRAKPQAGRIVPRYAWTGEGLTIEEALEQVIVAAKDAPEMKQIKGKPCRPKLGGREFDE